MSESEVLLVFPPLSNESIREAVKLWRHDQAQATEKYNHINKWNTSQVTDMSFMFYGASSFNQDVSEWDVSNVTDMSYMFYNKKSFNQDVSGWNVSNVTDMSYMFHGASSFNQDVSEWDVSNVTDMLATFYKASSFNQDVSKWDVSNVTDMSYMFYGALLFNQDVSVWDVSNVTNMSYMFEGASSFMQDLSVWDVSNASKDHEIFSGTPVQLLLRERLRIPSFFDGEFGRMSRTRRQAVFSRLFRWPRRKSFVLFLAGQGHISFMEGQHCNDVHEVMSCDCLFDVMDLSRYIITFL